MNKETYLDALETELKQYEITDYMRYIEYYRELIEDSIEDGKTELEALDNLGDAQSVVKRILSEQRDLFIKKPKGKLHPGVLILLVLGSPLWLSLLVALMCVLFAIFIIILIAYFILWLIPFMSGLFTFVFGMSGIAMFLTSFVFMVHHFAAGLMQLGVGIFALGVGILLFFQTRMLIQTFMKKHRQLSRSLKYTIKRKAIRYEFKS